MKRSLTITSLFVFILVWIFQQTGMEIGESEVQTFIEVLLKIASLIGIYVGRIRKGDVSIFGGRI
jgi:uncharacterized membrane protein